MAIPSRAQAVLAAPVGLRVAIPGMLTVLLPLLVSGCGGGGEGRGAPEIEVEGGWVRAMEAPPPGEGGGRSAAYLVIRNPGAGADTLVGGEAEGAGSLELHESREVDGVMRMRPVEGVEIPAGGTAELRPGGLHIMLLDLEGSLEEGDTLAFALRFRRSGVVTVRLPVLRVGPS